MPEPPHRGSASQGKPGLLAGSCNRTLFDSRIKESSSLTAMDVRGRSRSSDPGRSSAEITVGTSPRSGQEGRGEPWRDPRVQTGGFDELPRAVVFLENGNESLHWTGPDLHLRVTGREGPG
jgi:hypothetical protein